MNLEKGFKRITLLLSIVIGLTIFTLLSANSVKKVNHMQQRYNYYKNKCDNITIFWQLWDTNQFSVENDEILKILLDSYTHELDFANNEHTVILGASEIFPGLEKVQYDWINLPHATTLKSNIQKQMILLAPTAKETALQKANSELVSTKEKWSETAPGTKTEAILFSTLPASGGFAAVWILFFLLRWIARGFNTSIVISQPIG